MKKLPMENNRIVRDYKKLRSRFFMVIFVSLLCFMLFAGTVIVYLYRAGLLGRVFSNPIITVAVLWLLSFLVASLLALYVNRNILTPIEHLSEASKKVATGDFSVRLPAERSSEEMYTTFSNFNKMIEKLSSVETLRNDFVANVSHEFKTPLSAIEGYATLLQDETVSGQERTEYAKKILLNTRRLSDLTTDILLLSKLENQAEIPEKNNFRLDEQLREAILIFEPKWTAKRINFNLDFLPERSYFGPESILLQVWINIIGNAVKFVREEGNITVSAEETADFVKVKIADDGIGMDEKTRLHIFDRFYQGDTSHRSQGNGLGLTLCLKAVALVGGKIAVDSKENEGSVFTVTLPKNKK